MKNIDKLILAFIILLLLLIGSVAYLNHEAIQAWRETPLREATMSDLAKLLGIFFLCWYFILLSKPK